jgi:hypothetical protein
MALSGMGVPEVGHAAVNRAAAAVPMGMALS